MAGRFDEIEARARAFVARAVPHGTPAAARA
jgi:hypothetical protein